MIGKSERRKAVARMTTEAVKTWRVEERGEQEIVRFTWSSPAMFLTLAMCRFSNFWKLP